MMTSNPLVAILLDIFVVIPTLLLAFYILFMIPVLFFGLLDKLSDHSKQSGLDSGLTAIGAIRRRRYLEERHSVWLFLEKIENKYKFKRMTYGDLTSGYRDFETPVLLWRMENLFERGEKAIRDLHNDAVFSYYPSNYIGRIKNVLTDEDYQELGKTTHRLYRVYRWWHAEDRNQPIYTKRYISILKNIDNKGRHYRKLKKQLADRKTYFENIDCTEYESNRFTRLLHYADDPFFNEKQDYSLKKITKKDVENYHVEQAIGKVEY